MFYLIETAFDRARHALRRKAHRDKKGEGNTCGPQGDWH